MESLLILILSVIVSGILSAKKKKKTAGPAHPEETTSLPSSPWDDLIRDLQRGREGGPYEAAPVVDATSEERPSGDRPLSSGADKAPFEETFTEDREDASEPSPYFTYDDQALAELSARQETELSEAVHPAGKRPASETEKGPSAAESEPSSPASTLFPNGFDPRMAVLYAEIMTPKFRQY